MGAQPPERRHPFVVDRLHSSPEYLRRVEAAERLQIPVKRLDGWEPREVTECEYDDQDRLIRSVTTREPEWDEHSQAEMLALARYRDLTCKGCGGWLPETTDIDAEDTYVAELVRCHRCTAFDIGATRAHELTHPSSLLLQVDRRE